MTEISPEVTPESVVLGFYDAWNTIGFDAAYKKFLHQDVVVWNPGLGDWNGFDAVIAGLTAYLAVFGRPYASVDLKHIAVNGDVVLTERVETNRSEDGQDTYQGPLMSRFVVEGDKIVQWAEYYDPAPYQFGAALPTKQLAWKN
ncbi:nuclear transport factor 2 family protein [Streptomyces sp. NPDC058001]|uniref:nuclear transport factor 2 family protein n=1 Tax=Streptomyces sp. NPDC058001 TaxID=3346300 RepID=UPI0036EF2854